MSSQDHQANELPACVFRGSCRNTVRLHSASRLTANEIRGRPRRHPACSEDARPPAGMSGRAIDRPLRKDRNDTRSGTSRTSPPGQPEQDDHPHPGQKLHPPSLAKTTSHSRHREAATAITFDGIPIRAGASPGDAGTSRLSRCVGSSRFMDSWYCTFVQMSTMECLQVIV